MKCNRNVTYLAFAVLLAAFTAAHAQGPALGAPPPELRLQDQDAKWHTLADYRGKWVVLYFYTKDQAPSCTTEAREFRDSAKSFGEARAVILGVSVDDVESHKKFATRNELPFPILADSTKDAAKRYGVLKSFPGAGELARRDTFVIDPQGRLVKRYANVDAKGHAAAVLADLQALQKK